MKKLTPKEQLFCLYFSQDRNGRQAAAKAGYRTPQKASVRLLSRKEIREAIAENENKACADAAEVLAGYRKLAFGSGADALRLLFAGTPPDDFDALDLFNIAEIKKPKDGALEIKFFDRLKALEHLETASGALSGADSAQCFYDALLRSAESTDEA